MNHHHRTDDGPLRPEMFAGYLDGELDEPARQAMEAWLTERPVIAAELATHARLGRLFAATAPRAPSERAWREILDGIEAGVAVALAAGPAVAVPAPSPSRWRVPVRVAALLASAAALLVALYIGFSDRADRDLDDHELLVADATEVDITSMDGGALNALVVGEGPVRGPLELATMDNIRVHRFKPVARNRFSIVDTIDDDDDDSGFPMLVAQK